MKLRRGSLKALLLAVVGSFSFSLFMLLEAIHRESNLNQSLEIGGWSQDIKNVQTEGIPSQDIVKPVKDTHTQGLQRVIILQNVTVLPEVKTERKVEQAEQNITEEVHTESNFSCSSNSVFYNLTELAKENRLIYNMVPKCGSLGVRGILTKSGNKLMQGNYNIGFDYLAPFHHKTEHVIRMVNEDLNNRLFQSGARYIYQKHLHFIDFSITGAKTPYYMNVVRDPVEHHISMYYFQRENRKLKMFAPWHLLIENTEDGKKERLQRSYEDCVKINDMECASDDFLFTIIPFFCGQDLHCLKPSRKALEQAKSNVIKYFPLVGYVENLSDFFQLGKVLWPQFFRRAPGVYESVKFTSHKTGARRKEPSNEVKDIMRKRMPLEYEFYNWIKQRFHCMYDIYVNNSIQQNNTVIGKDL